MATTQNLKIPLIEGSDILVRQKFNEAFEAVDKNALHAGHKNSQGHWPLWEPGKDYQKQDVVKTSSCPSWGFLECTIAGRSGTVEPSELFGEGDIKVDGAVTWILRRLTSTIRKHSDLADRDKTGQHPIAAIEGLEIVLEDIENKAHQHRNKDILDKFSEKEGKLVFDDKLLVGGASLWEIGTDYQVSNLVVYNGFLYRCIASHTAADTFDITKWELLEIGYIPNWQAGVKYQPFVVVTHGNNILRCIKSHTSVSFDNTEKACWEVLAGKGASLGEWQPNTGYELNEAVVYNDIIYRCTGSHTSSVNFSDDMIPGTEKWRAINGFSVAGSLRQVTKLGVIAPATIDIIINNTNTFNLPPVEVLKFTPGLQNQVITVCQFDNSDADDFIVEGVSGEQFPYYIWDGTMSPKTRYQKEVTSGLLANGKYFESDFIDFSEYQKIESINM